MIAPIRIVKWRLSATTLRNIELLRRQPLSQISISRAGCLRTLIRIIVFLRRCVMEEKRGHCKYAYYDCGGPKGRAGIAYRESGVHGRMVGQRKLFRVRHFDAWRDASPCWRKIDFAELHAKARRLMSRRDFLQLYLCRHAFFLRIFATRRERTSFNWL